MEEKKVVKNGHHNHCKIFTSQAGIDISLKTPMTDEQTSTAIAIAIGDLVPWFMSAILLETTTQVIMENCDIKPLG